MNNFVKKPKIKVHLFLNYYNKILRANDLENSVNINIIFSFCYGCLQSENDYLYSFKHNIFYSKPDDAKIMTQSIFCDANMYFYRVIKPVRKYQEKAFKCGHLFTRVENADSGLIGVIGILMTF